MNSKPEKPLRLFVNPIAIWTGLAFKTGEAMLASVHAAAAKRANAPRVAVIAANDAPPAKPRSKETTSGKTKRRAVR